MGGCKSQGEWSQVRRKSRPTNWWYQPADLQPVRRRSLPTQVADQIRRRITLGDLKAGQRIESSRRLASELNVSLPVVREALAALAYLGIIEVRHGVGTFVARRLMAARILRVSRRVARRTELHAMRTMLAVQAASRAAGLRQAESRSYELALMLEERVRSARTGDPRRFTRADLEFHAFVAASGGNALQASIERLVGSALWSDLAGRAKQLALNRDLEERHADLLTAIEEHDRDGAAAAARAIGLSEATSDE